MAKFSKKSIFIVLLALCLTLCLVLVACDKDDKTPTYTVTVLSADSAPAQGVKVTITKGGASFDTKTTDANGKATFKLPADTYTVELDDLPSTAEIPADTQYTLTAENKQLTITLTEKFSYKVQFKNVDGTPFFAEGVKVGVCTFSGNCLEMVDLASNGIAKMFEAKGDYHVKAELPLNFTYDHDENGYYTGESFSSTKTQMEITVYPVTAFDFKSAEMTLEEKTAYAQENPLFESYVQYPAYKYDVTVGAGETKFFAIAPTTSGTYHIEKSDDLTYVYLQNQFLAEGSATGGGFFPPNPVLEKGKTYYFRATNDTEEPMNASFVFATPAATSLKLDGVGGTAMLTVYKENANAIIEFKPTAAAKYTATVQGETLAYIKTATSSYGQEFSDDIPDASFVKNSSASAKMTESEIATGRTIYFVISIKTDTYPQNVTVKIVKDQNISDTTNVMTVKETLTQYGNQEGTLTPVPQNDATNLVYNQRDKFYHFGTDAGPVVVVMLKGTLPSSRFGEQGMLYSLDTTVRAKYIFDMTSDNDKADLTKGNTFEDYRLFLRGFNDFVLTYPEGSKDPIYNEPADITTQNYYTKYVNKDGVYPLTEELKVFLEKFYTANAQTFFFQVSMSAQEGYEWMFPLFYYGEESSEDEPAIVGEYGFFSMNEGGTVYNIGDNYFGMTLAANSYKLTVNADNTYTIEQLQSAGPGGDGTTYYEEIEAGVWAINSDGTYTFSFSDFMGTVERTINFDETNKQVTFIEYEEMLYIFKVAASNETIDGVYELVSYYDANDERTWSIGDDCYGIVITKEYFKLTVNADGTYIIEQYVENPRLGTSGYEEYESGEWTDNGDGTYTFSFTDFMGTVTYTVTLENGTITFTSDNIAMYVFSKVVEEAIDGEYELVSFYDSNDEQAWSVGDDCYGIAITKEYFKLTVNADGTYIIEQYVENPRLGTAGYEEYESGEWTDNGDGTYTFSFTDFMGTVTYTVTLENGTITFTSNEIAMYVFTKIVEEA